MGEFAILHRLDHDLKDSPAMSSFNLDIWRNETARRL